MPRYFRLWATIGVGVLALSGAWLAVTWPQFRSTRQVVARLPDPGRLQPEAPVYYHGVEVGRVTDVAPIGRGDTALIHLAVRTHPPVPLSTKSKVQRRRLGPLGADVVDLVDMTAADVMTEPRSLEASDTLAGLPAAPLDPRAVAAQRALDSLSASLERARKP